jgi:hypothetical protein
MQDKQTSNQVPLGQLINPTLTPIAVHQNDADEEFPALLDDFTLSEFVAGNCAYLAAALHETTGWEIFEEYCPNDDYSVDRYGHVHAWVKNPKGNAVDILGEHQGNWAATKHSHKDDKRVILPASAIDPTWYEKVLKIPALSTETLNEAKVWEKTDLECMNWARALLGKYPAYFGITPVD